MADKKENTKTLAQNKKARHEYFILETIEAGIELAGTEVKSARLGKVNLTDAYASIKNGEVFIKQMNISPFEQGNIFNRDPLRDRKLLLHKKYIHHYIFLSIHKKSERKIVQLYKYSFSSLLWYFITHSNY